MQRASFLCKGIRDIIYLYYKLMLRGYLPDLLAGTRAARQGGKMVDSAICRNRLIFRKLIRARREHSSEKIVLEDI